MKINTYYNLDKPTAPKENASNLPKRQISPQAWLSLSDEERMQITQERKNSKNKVITPTREKLATLHDMRTKKYTPEESTKEKDRILSVLEKVEFDNIVQATIKAIIENKFVPKELIQSGTKVMRSEIGIIMEIMQNGNHMTEEDQKEVLFTIIGGEGVLRDMLQALPETVVEIPINPEGTEIKKISWTILIPWIQEVLKKLVR
jgi:hypothetical protein